MDIAVYQNLAALTHLKLAGEGGRLFSIDSEAVSSQYQHMSMASAVKYLEKLW